MGPSQLFKYSKELEVIDSVVYITRHQNWPDFTHIYILSELMAAGIMGTSVLKCFNLLDYILLFATITAKKCFCLIFAK